MNHIISAILGTFFSKDLLAIYDELYYYHDSIDSFHLLYVYIIYEKRDASTTITTKQLFNTKKPNEKVSLFFCSKIPTRNNSEIYGNINDDKIISLEDT